MSGQIIGPIGVLPTGGSTTTFDPAFENGGQTLSNGNLTVANNGGTTISRSIASHATGKYYWEVLIGDNTNSIIGICSATEVNTDFVSSSGKSAGIFGSGIWLGISLSGTTTADTVVTTGIWAFALDATNKTVWAKKMTGLGASNNWNADGTANPATNVNGCNFSASTDLGTAAIYVAVTVAGATDQCTFNFGATAYTGTPPSGFGNM